MSSISDQSIEFNAELLKINYFCTGIKHGNRYVCGNEVNDPGVINNAVNLLTETVNRILHWRVWDTWWIQKRRQEWLRVVEALKENNINNEGLRAINEIVNYVDRFQRYWNSVGNEIYELVNSLLSGNENIIIRRNGVSVHKDHITIEADLTNNVTVHVVFNDFKGINIRIPDVFGADEVLKRIIRAIRDGLEVTDGYEYSSKYSNNGENTLAAMATSQEWQALLWLLGNPGKVHVRIGVINVNEHDVSITYFITTDYVARKYSILKDAEKFDDRELLAFILGAYLGDGSVTMEQGKKGNSVYNKYTITLSMSSEEFEMWRPILEKLRKDFRWGKSESKNAVYIRFYSGVATDLAKAVIGALPMSIRNILDSLDFEKWRKLKIVAEMRPKFRLGDRALISGYEFTVHVHSGTIELMHYEKDENAAKKVREELAIKYGNLVSIYRTGRRLAVVIPVLLIEKYDEIKREVIKTICRKIEKTEDEKRRTELIKALRRLALVEGSVDLLCMSCGS